MLWIGGLEAEFIDHHVRNFLAEVPQQLKQELKEWIEAHPCNGIVQLGRRFEERYKSDRSGKRCQEPFPGLSFTRRGRLRRRCGRRGRARRPRGRSGVCRSIENWALVPRSRARRRRVPLIASLPFRIDVIRREGTRIASASRWPRVCAAGCDPRGSGPSEFIPCDSRSPWRVQEPCCRRSSGAKSESRRGQPSSRSRRTLSAI